MKKITLYLVSHFHSNTKSFLTLAQSAQSILCPPTNPATTQIRPLHMATAAINVSLGKLGGKHLLLSLVRVGLCVSTNNGKCFFLVTFPFPIPMPKISSHLSSHHFIAINVPRWESVHFHGSSSRGHSASIFSMGISGNGQSSTRKGRRRAERINLVSNSSIQVDQSHHHCHSS